MFSFEATIHFPNNVLCFTAEAGLYVKLNRTQEPL